MLMMKSIILISCIALFLQTGHATRPFSSQAFDPQKCAQSATKAAVCFTDFWTHFGRPSVECCKALEEIDDSCLPSLFPKNPFIAPFFKTLCSGGGGGGGGGGFPFPPFPFPPIGGGGGFPFPPFPFPFPPVGGGAGGSGASAPPPKA